MIKKITIPVENDEETPIRLDAYCVRSLKNMTRSQFKSGLQIIRVNGQATKLSKAVHNGDVIYLEWENPIPTTIIPENISVSILFENEDVIVVNKEQGMVSHPGAGNWSGTLVHALAYYRRNLSSICDEFSKIDEDVVMNPDFFRQGIVHRLDKDTSGVMITARNKYAQGFLKKQFQKKKVKKYYLALIKGVPQRREGEIKTSVFRDPKKRIRFAASYDLSKGKFAHSAYKVLESYGTYSNSYSLIMVKLYTGRTHQIRIHLSFLGHPIIGDPIYGKKDKLFPTTPLMLHAYKLKISLPRDTLSKHIFKSTPPEAFRKTISFLRNKEW